MPITYGYEGSLVGPAVGMAGTAGYNQALADARRFTQTQQLAYDQMAQQRSLEAQRLAQQRWMQQADLYGSMQRIGAQGSINQQLQAAAAQNRMKELEARHGYTQLEQADYWKARQEYEDYVLKARLDAEGEARKRAIDMDLGMADSMFESGEVDEFERDMMKRDIYRKALGTPWGTMMVEEGDDGTTYTDPATRNRVHKDKEGRITILGPERARIAESIANGTIMVLDADGNVLMPDPTTGTINLSDAAAIMTPNRDGGVSVQNIASAQDKMEMKFNEQKLQVEKREAAAKMYADAYKAYISALSKPQLDDGPEIPKPPSFSEFLNYLDGRSGSMPGAGAGGGTSLKAIDDSVAARFAGHPQSVEDIKTIDALISKNGASWATWSNEDRAAYNAAMQRLSSQLYMRPGGVGVQPGAPSSGQRGSSVPGPSAAVPSVAPRPAVRQASAPGTTGGWGSYAGPAAMLSG